MVGEELRMYGSREREREREVVVRYDNTPTDISIIYLADVVRIFARREYIL